MARRRALQSGRQRNRGRDEDARYHCRVAEGRPAAGATNPRRPRRASPEALRFAGPGCGYRHETPTGDGQITTYVISGRGETVDAADLKRAASWIAPSKTRSGRPSARDW